MSLTLSSRKQLSADHHNGSNLRGVQLLFLLTPFLFFGASCSIEPEEDGQCAISCSGAKIGASNYTIKPLAPFTNAVCRKASATDTAALEGPLRMQFLIEKKLQTIPNIPDLNAKKAEEEEELMAVDKTIPVSGVAFRPMVVGSMAVGKTNPENDSAVFPGIVTPKSEWCSDSCGVMTVDFWPNCIEAAEVSVSVASGAAVGTSDPVTLTDADAADAASTTLIDDDGDESIRFVAPAFGGDQKETLSIIDSRPPASYF
jgi:hypothetical protein